MLYKIRMSHLYAVEKDLIKAGIESSPLLGEALVYAYKLRFAGILKEDQVRQILGWK